MRVLIAAGGTAGHVNPALAIAKEIEKHCPGAEIHFAGRKKGMEYGLVTKAGYPFHHIEVNGIQRKLTLRNVARNVKAMYHLALSAPCAAAILRKVQPDLVIGAGGYVSGPVVQTAAKKGILTAIHEQNAFPGITNKILAKSVDLVFVAMPDAVERLGPAAKGKTFVVGNPVREAMWNTDRTAARKALGAKDGQIVVVSFGGSLGAQRLNEAVAELAVWELKERDFLHIHATGSIEKKDFAALAKKLNIDNDARFQIREYIEDMPSMLAAADLVISRAGALTLAEISAVGRAAVLIPSPNVAENHQYYNAMQLEKLGAARVLEEKNLGQGALQKTVDEITHSQASLMEMGAKARALAQPDSLEKIWTHLEQLLKTGRP
ncbi:MAG TPA: undecaprenyldiphospho-muramoylpentapeptide beta-N-acetylglucosaminyltransferase [Candidatus Ruthenibacterium avium]|uniref:UDP-N-acetylglucosamine--N-acetylmuramyl-(pentapeptide) pyrophosphoryl-undecaprenol N-acetylglucosamine transferase n=1 Tax=Candidatus Ruthenibacterium avium TaxID=2838751 RepID=A0A9D2S0V4_9FIRM|nr:undecaprenyldiphospho-muramoylpentapeptide beta-N-acetylglucosaminyltransferase [Candidatus Ruthenibacterium avium]